MGATNSSFLGRWILIFFLSLYILTAQGSIQSLDGQIMFDLTRSIVEKGSVAIENPAAVKGIDGRLYSKYGLGQSVAVIPLYLLGKLAGSVLPLSLSPEYLTKFFVSLFNPIITALTCLLIFLFGKKLGYSPRISLILTILFGLGTMAWPYSQSFFSEPLTTLLLLLSVWLAFAYKDGEKKSRLILSGFSLGLAIATRVAVAVAIFPLVIYLVLIRPEKSKTKAVNNILLFLLPILLIIGLISFYNFYRFGDPLQTGYGKEGFTTPLFVGLYGLLASPGRSFFLYNPILILSLSAFLPFLRRHREEGILFILLVSFTLILYARWSAWEGGWAWGPRFLLILIPFILLPMGSWLEGTKSFHRKAVIWSLFALSLVIQLSAISVSFERYFYEKYIEFPRTHMEKIEFEPRHSPLIGQWRSIAAVIRNLRKPGFLSQLAQSQKFRGLKEQEIGKRKFLAQAIALNSPNFWLFYAYYAGFPKAIIFLIFLILVFILGISGYILATRSGIQPSGGDG